MTVRIVPLGGLGEVGMNALLLEDGEDAILIDCGIMFPDQEVGIDVMHADFSPAAALGERLKAVVLTHAHEDHIGAVPFLLSAVRVPIYGSPLALELLRERFAEHELGFKPELIPTEPRRPFRVGALSIEPIQVTHSIPEAQALAVRTSAGVVVHTGDFKVDLNPPDGHHFDLQRLSEYGAAGVSLLLSDSTNVEEPGITGGEKEVAEELDRVVEGAGDARVFAALFSSNLQRLQAVINAAERHGRRIALVGRSVVRNVEVALRLKLLRLPSPLVVPVERVKDLPRRQTLVVVAGTQGEPRSVLTRLSLNDHRHLAIEPGDLVVFSSRQIPGNELAVARVIDNLARLGARVVHRGNRPRVHASGHAQREEQKLMIQLVRPRCFIPVHGNYQHLAGHARLAAELGVASTLLLEDGQAAELDEHGLRRAGSVPVERVHRDGLADVGPQVIDERRLLADSGLLCAFVVLDRDHRLAAEPQVVCTGVAAPEEVAPILAAAERALREDIEAAPEAVRAESVVLRDRCRRLLRRHFDRALGRRPLALVNLSVLEASPRVPPSFPRRDSLVDVAPLDDPSVDPGREPTP